MVQRFDAAHDKIDLIGFTGVSDFASLVIADDANCNAVMTIADGAILPLGGLIEFGASSSEDVTFAAVGDGTLKLDLSTNLSLLCACRPFLGQAQSEQVGMNTSR